MKGKVSSDSRVRRILQIQISTSHVCRSVAKQIVLGTTLSMFFWGCLCAMVTFFPLAHSAARTTETQNIERQDHGNVPDAPVIPELTRLPMQRSDQIGYSVPFYPGFPKQYALGLLHAKIAVELLDIASERLSQKIEEAAAKPKGANQQLDMAHLLRAVAARLSYVSFQDKIQYQDDVEGFCTVIGTLTMEQGQISERIAQALRQRDTLDTISLALDLRSKALAQFKEGITPEALPEPRDSKGRVFSGESKNYARNWLSKATLRKTIARFNGVETALRFLSLRGTSKRFTDLKGTLETLQAETESDPDNPVLLFLLGEALMQERPQAAAIDAFTKALEAAENHAPTLYERGLAFLSLYLPEQALEDFSSALAVRHAPNFFLARGSVYMKLGNYPLMCRDYADACTLGQCEGYEWAQSRGYCKKEPSSATQ